MKHNLENSRGKESLLFLPIFLFAMFFPSWCCFLLLLFPFCLNSFLYPFFWGSSTGDKFSLFSFENILISPSFLKNIFTRIESWLEGSFLWALENCCAPSSWPLWWEICCHLCHFCLIGKAFFLSHYLRNFFFVFSSQKIDYNESWGQFLRAYSLWSLLSFLNL